MRHSFELMTSRVVLVLVVVMVMSVCSDSDWLLVCV